MNFSQLGWRIRMSWMDPARLFRAIRFLSKQMRIMFTEMIISVEEAVHCCRRSIYKQTAYAKTLVVLEIHVGAETAAHPLMHIIAARFGLRNYQHYGSCITSAVDFAGM